jgi:hypothetical protein
MIMTMKHIIPAFALGLAASLHAQLPQLLVNTLNPLAITFTASGESSAINLSEDMLNGGLNLLGFFAEAPGSSISSGATSSDLMPYSQPSAADPAGAITQAESSGTTLYLWGSGTADFVTSQPAFTGEAVFSLSNPAGYGAGGELRSVSTGDLIGTWSVVPEPQTYAMIAGLGLAGFAAVRRMRKA